MPSPELDRLSARLDAVERRLRALEQRTGPTTVEPRREVPSAAARSEARTPAETAALAGRMALVLGGAFLVRSATQAGILTPRFGVLLGLAYALAWLLAADRAALRGRVRGAVAHAAMAALIGLPLVWEATARFRFLSLVQSWTAAAAIFAAYYLVARRHRMPVLLWPIVIAFTPFALALGLATRDLPPWLFLLLLTSTLLQGSARRLRRFRPIATTSLVLLNLSLALTTGMAWVAPPLVLEHALVPWRVLAVQTATFVLGTGPLLIRAARRGRIHPRDAWHAASATVLGLGGAIAVGHHAGASTAMAGAAALVLGLAACTIGSRGTAQAAVLGAPGLAIALVGIFELLPWTSAVLAVCCLAVAAAIAAALPRREGRGAWLGMQAATLGIVALVVSGVLPWGIRVLVGASPGDPPRTVQAAALGAALACCAVPAAARTRGLTGMRSTLLLAVVLSLGGLLVVGVASLFPARAAGSPLLPAVLRTTVIALAAVSVARAGSFEPLREGHRLVYPLLVAGGIKILVDDVRTGDPTVLVVSFSIYGAALILAPRLVRSTQPG